MHLGRKIELIMDYIRIMGIELQGSKMVYVVGVFGGGSVTFETGNSIVLANTRTRDALVAFQTTLKAILNDAAPQRIAVKLKPESGKMSAGAAALKMEALLLTNSPCEVVFVSAQRLAKGEAVANPFPKYAQDAVLAALAVA